MARILVVEDERDLAGLLQYNLRQASHEVELASSGKDGLAKLQGFQPHLVLLDLMLPDVPGGEVIRQMRAQPSGTKVPVVMVTARGSEAERIAGLELGADDYVVKPFSVRELMLRVEAVLRRAGVPANPARAETVLVSGTLKVDTERHEVTLGQAPLVLTLLEFKLLRTLLEREGTLLSRERLLSDVWGIAAPIETRTVDTHIKRLRQKLGPAGERIETVRGVGYRMNPPPETDR